MRGLEWLKEQRDKVYATRKNRKRKLEQAEWNKRLHEKKNLRKGEDRAKDMDE